MKRLFKPIDYSEIKIKVFDGDKNIFKVTAKPESALAKLKQYMEEKYG